MRIVPKQHRAAAAAVEIERKNLLGFLLEVSRFANTIVLSAISGT